MTVTSKVRKYVEQNGSSCPYCGSNNIVYGSAELPNAPVSCEQCHETWCEIWQLVGVDLLNGEPAFIPQIYIDGDRYVCMKQSVGKKEIFWTLHSSGWEAYLGEEVVYSTDEITFPTSEDFVEAEEIAKSR